MKGKVTVAELIERGLSSHPANVVGVGFPAVDAVLCRSHVDASALHHLGVGDEDRPPTAVLLIGGTNTEHALRTWCASCKTPAPRDNVREAAVNASTCAICTQPIDWTGKAWEHRTTGAWSSTPVRHQASPVPKARPAPIADRQDRDADHP